MIKILVDTSADYTLEEIQAQGLECVPIHITLGGNDYKDSYDLTKEGFYELLLSNEEVPTTAQPSPQAFIDVFEQAKEAGDELICILLSSKLSGTVQTANLAKNMVEYDKIHIVDSLGATHFNRILADHAQKRVKEGASAETIVTELESLRKRVRVAAAIDTLEYLYKGGRVSRAAAVIGEMARIKPMISVIDGEVIVIGKCMGKNKAISSLLKYIEERPADPEFPIYTLYTYGTENSDVFGERFAKAGYESKECLQIGATIGTHVGPGAFGIIYVEKE